ncbi:MAG: malonyl-ACP O-methyltransferase BioC [Candidatus Gastranaerophilales bacterium]|nr:malonyl-ACP O-methyltransferase BioC [Candidatus Gastranaerophilales bacterium]
MIIKDLIKNSFSKNFKSYDKNALVQKLMADELAELLSDKEISSVFEIGMGTGFLTKKINEKFCLKSYTANDIAGCECFLQKINPSFDFLQGDIEALNLTGSYDAVVSNAVLQWMCDFDGLFAKIKRCLNDKGVFAFSTFGLKNYQEVKTAGGNVLEYKSMSELEALLQKYFKVEIIYEREKVLYFPTVKDVLKHIKKTGVNATSESPMSISELKKFQNQYAKLNSTPLGFSLTYNPVYVLCSKNSN